MCYQYSKLPRKEVEREEKREKASDKAKTKKKTRWKKVKKVAEQVCDVCSTFFSGITYTVSVMPASLGAGYV